MDVTASRQRLGVARLHPKDVLWDSSFDGHRQAPFSCRDAREECAGKAQGSHTRADYVADHLSGHGFGLWGGTVLRAEALWEEWGADRAPVLKLGSLTAARAGSKAAQGNINLELVNEIQASIPGSPYARQVELAQLVILPQADQNRRSALVGARGGLISVEIKQDVTTLELDRLTGPKATHSHGCR